MARGRLKALALVAALSAVGALVASSTIERRCARLAAAGEALSVPLARLTKGSGEFFCYRTRAGEKLRFVLARLPDDTVQAAFDACGRCYKFHQGFDADHGYLRCRYCGNRYKMSEIGVGKASCVPIKLRSKLKGADVRVEVADLEAGRWLF